MECGSLLPLLKRRQADALHKHPRFFGHESEPRCLCRRGGGAPCRLCRKAVKPNLPHKSGSSFMDRIEDLPNNLPFTTYNLHRLWAPAHPKSFRVFLCLVFSYYYPQKSCFCSKIFQQMNLQVIGIQVLLKYRHCQSFFISDGSVRSVGSVGSLMDEIEDIPNNLPFTTYNLHGLWAPVHAKYSVCSVVTKAFWTGVTLSSTKRRR